MFSIKNKQILIIGASKGIGYEVSKKLHEHKAKIIGIARSDINPTFEYLKVDITKSKQIVNLCQFIK